MRAPTAPIVALDVETTGLGVDDQVWEVAWIIRGPDGVEDGHRYFVRHDTARARGLPEAFRADHAARYDALWALGADLVADQFAADLRTDPGGPRPHIVGLSPQFDTAILGRWFAALQIPVPWSHHLIDVRTLAVGHLAASGVVVPPPWSSDAISTSLGVAPPGPGVRHTAMGDARWALDMYDAVMGAGDGPR